MYRMASVGFPALVFLAACAWPGPSQPPVSAMPAPTPETTAPPPGKPPAPQAAPAPAQPQPESPAPAAQAPQTAQTEQAAQAPAAQAASGLRALAEQAAQPTRAAAPPPAAHAKAKTARHDVKPPAGEARGAPPEKPAAVASAPPQPEKPAPATTAPPQPAATAAPALDLPALEDRLRNTHAIGVFTKLSLKNNVDDLLAAFRAFYNGALRTTLADLRQRYDALLMKVLTLLQNGDPPLASAVSASRDAIWGILSDRDKFRKYSAR